jgi:hypothetical protein
VFSLKWSHTTSPNCFLCQILVNSWCPSIFDDWSNYIFVPLALTFTSTPQVYKVPHFLCVFLGWLHLTLSDCLLCLTLVFFL